MILEDQNVLEQPVLLQIENSIAEGPQNIFDTFRRQRCEVGIMIWRLDDHFVCADAVHAVKHTFGLSVQISLNAKRRELVGDYAHGPSWRVPLGTRSTIRIRTIRLSFGRRFALVPIAERTKATLNLHIFPHKIGWALCPIGRDNHPPSNNRIFPKLWHSLNPFNRDAQTLHFTPPGRHCETLRSAGGSYYRHSIRSRHRTSIGRKGPSLSNTPAPPAPLPVSYAYRRQPQRTSHRARFASSPQRNTAHLFPIQSNQFPRGTSANDNFGPPSCIPLFVERSTHLLRHAHPRANVWANGKPGGLVSQPNPASG